MKNILLSFLFLSLSVYGQWVELDTGIEVSYFSDVYALSTDVAVVVGSNGTIIKTTDGGETWEQKDSGTTFGLAKVQFATPNIGYVIGGRGTLLKTVDSGEAWNSIDTGYNSIFVNISCVNENIVYISGIFNSNKGLLKSLDGGETWEQIIVENLSIDGYDDNFQFLTSEIGFMSNENYAISKTVDGGETWSEIEGYNPFYFINPSIGFINGFKTVDGGDSFTSIYTEDIGFTQIYAINENIIWGIRGYYLDGDASTRGLVKISSTDSINYFESILSEDSPSIEMSAIHFANEITGYIVGYKYGMGTIWKNETGINEGLHVKEVDTLKNIKVYPNPSSSELNIDLSDISGKNVVVSLMDVTGKQVFSKSFMQKQININTRQFAKGTYILQLKTNDKNYTQKVIIN